MPSPRRLGPLWALEAMTRTGDRLGALLGAVNVSLTWRLDGPAELGFEIDGANPTVTELEELISDVAAYRDGELLFRGRLYASGDEIDADTHRVTFTAVDYRGVLAASRTLWPGTTAVAAGYAATDAGAIAWDLIADSQALTAGDLGITRELPGTTGILRDRAVGYYEAGKGLEEAVADLGHLSNGFDWEVGPDLVFRLWHPQRGSVRDFLVHLVPGGGNVVRASRAVDPSEFANVWRQSGADGVPAVTRTVADLADRPEGRWEHQDGDTDLGNATAVGDRADRRLDDSATLEPSWSFTLKRGVWTPADLWLGDTFGVRVRRGRLDVDRSSRVLELTAKPDDGGEVVEVVADRPPLARKSQRLLRNVVGRLETLERR